MKKQWHGSGKADVIDGEATFQVYSNTEPVVIHLDSLHDFHKICALLDDANHCGFAEGLDECSKAVKAIPYRY